MSVASVLMLHIITRDAYFALAEEELYQPPSLAEEGFIHCSTPAQVAGVANRFYRNAGDLLLLVVDPVLVTAPIYWEAPSLAGDDTPPAPGAFPHIYGPLNMDAVQQVIAYEPDAGGVFHPPVIVTGEE